METATAERPEELQVVLRMDESLRGQLRQAEGIVAVAQAYVIEDASTADLANTELRSIIGRKKKIEELRTGFVAPARQIIENARALFNPALAALEQAEGILKGNLLGWHRKEEQRIADARRALEEAERKVRQEAEARAAAERARAAEAERRAREEAEAAERRRREAEEAARKAREAGDKAAAAEAERRAKAEAAERARKEEAERIAREEGERKAREAELAAAAASAPITHSAEAAVPKGFQSRKNWVAELEPGKTEEDVKRAIVQAIVAQSRNDLLSLLALDMKAAAKLAKALEGNFNVPGLRARNNPVAASRAA